MNDQATPSIQAMIYQINDAGWLLNNLYQSGADRDGRHQWRVNLRSIRSDTTTKFYTDPTLHGALWAALQGVKDGTAMTWPARLEAALDGLLETLCDV